MKHSISFVLSSPDKPLILIPVRLNDKHNLRFILDTGASKTVISQSHSNILDLAENAELTDATGFGGVKKNSVRVHTVSSLSIGSAIIYDLEVAVIDIDHLTQALGEQIDGILGYNFLAKYKVSIDYKNSTIEFDDY